MVSCQSRLGGQVRSPQPLFANACVRKGIRHLIPNQIPMICSGDPRGEQLIEKKNKTKQEATNLWILGSTTRQQQQQGLHAVIRTLVLHSLFGGVLCFSLWVVSFFFLLPMCVCMCVFYFSQALIVTAAPTTDKGCECHTGRRVRLPG